MPRAMDCPVKPGNDKIYRAVETKLGRASVSRILFTYIAPFLLPILSYAGWVWYRTRYVAEHGGEAPQFEKGPWPLLLFVGAVLALGMLGISALLQGNSP